LPRRPRGDSNDKKGSGARFPKRATGDRLGIVFYYCNINPRLKKLAGDCPKAQYLPKYQEMGFLKPVILFWPKIPGQTCDTA